MHKVGSLPVVVAAFSILFPATAVAEISKDYSVMGRAAWSAFECSSLASKSNNLKEQERLFLFGYKQGQKFIAAVKAEKIKKEDLSSGVPTVMLLLLQGPTPDFMLGRIFESAQDSALKGIYKVGEHFNSEEEQTSAAKDKFWKFNCQLIGK
ncbi:MAG: hypothetical protein A3J74_02130 [Elusimicrobia bacterium RIFCSPHIGHO2_02_FULL_57_9]|nr:MAG: hypothetical protein A3J74_02130 [Elusimicrobia bacterium RIFCSPHIGHO2_02_FULL_57_9]